MSDPRRQLAQLYQRVVQDELGLVATIDEDGNVLFRHPDMGNFFISLNAEKDPEYMKLLFPACLYDATRGVPSEDLVQICNRLNVHAKLAIVTFHEKADALSVHVGLLLAAPDAFPDEALLRGVIRRAMSSIRSAAEKFAEELQA